MGIYKKLKREFTCALRNEPRGYLKDKEIEGQGVEKKRYKQELTRKFEKGHHPRMHLLRAVLESTD
jgi:hypothetical protein